ncbi:MAG: VWA domain-containing protein [Fluviicoccus sp.]|uniref:vWA domain-containing protein n=1 Tax=Fluviicoccus sp. TaxID=2003552 RepID=UPI00271A9AEC|nr:VWA domain-containing protein [Fluviicoccus sp.]MDO8330279.1 VWA domain-containing protein [Fluviicoccus sp.]
MLLNFFFTLKQYKVPVSVREYLDLLRALDGGLAFASEEEFYSLARVVLVKDEKHFDKFDRAMKHFFDGLATMENPLDNLTLPEDWLRKEVEKHLSPEELAELQKMGSLDKLMEEFKKRLEEQHKRHQGGNKMIGTGGTSPFGAYGANPEGIRMAGPSRNKSAVKVWEKREFKNLDDSQELGIRNMQVALRRLRRFARQGAAEELDIDDTIRCTAHNAGLLDIKMVPERRNRVKVLIFFDIGGSMDPYVQVCESLFSAARTEFKHLHYYYFHNFIYESVWQDNNRRWSERMPLWDVMHKYGPDYRVIFVGDATMSPYEIMSPGGSVEHFNEEAGAVWMQRVTQHFQKVVWLNPEPEKSWAMTQSIQVAKKLMEDRMYPLTLQGIEAATRYLSK